MIVSVFGIEVNKTIFTTKLLIEKREKTVNATTKTSEKRSLSFIKMKFLIRLLCSALSK